MLCSGHWLETALDTVLGTGQHHAPLLTLALNGNRHSTPCSGLCSQHWLETVLEDRVGVGARHGTWGLDKYSPHVSHAAMQPFHVEPRTTTDGRWLIVDVSPLSTTFVFPCPRQTNGHPTQWAWGHWRLGTHTHALMHECTKLAHHLFCLCHQVELDALKRSHRSLNADYDALKRKNEELRQDLGCVMLHACKGPFSKGPMSDDVDDIGHEDKKAKSELKQVNENSFAGQEEHQGNMLPESPPESPWMLLPDPVPDQEHPSDELEPLDLGQLDRQLDLDDMSSWSIPNRLG